MTKVNVHRLYIIPQGERGVTNTRYIYAKSWFFDKLHTHNFTFRELCGLVGITTKEQIDYFVQILQVADTNSKVFIPYKRIIERKLKINHLKQGD